MKQDYDMIPIPVSIRKKDGRYVYVNRAWTEMFSVGAETALGRTDDELNLSPLSLPGGGEESTQGDYVFRDVYVTTREKGRLLLELIETLFVDSAGEELVMCAHQDMTGIGWRMEDLGRHLTRSEYKARETIQHVLRLSRDMSGPLDQVTKYCAILADTDMSGEQQEWMAVVRDNVRILRGHIQRTVDVSAIEEGDRPEEERKTDIYSMLEEVRELYSMMAKERKITLDCHVSPSLERPVFIDRTRVRQILVNLLDIAVRGSKSGQVRISASMVPDSERPLCLKVRMECPIDANLPVPDSEHVEELPRLNMGLSHKIIRGLCAIIGGRFEISRDSDGSRIMRVCIRASRPLGQGSNA
jgi:signal transduction histidine kinase